MLRRVALGVLAAPVVLRGALAQGDPAAPGQSSGQMQSGQTQSGQVQSGRNEAGRGVVSAQTGPATQLQQDMLGAMAFALGTAQLGERQGENSAVRQFGGLEAEEQAAFTAARQQAGLRVPTVELMPEQKRQEMMQLRDLRGPQFDRLFIQGQLTSHQELLRLHEQAVRNPSAAAEGMLATVAIPAIKTHLVMLEGIQRTMAG